MREREREELCYTSEDYCLLQWKEGMSQRKKCKLVLEVYWCDIS